MSVVCVRMDDDTKKQFETFLPLCWNYGFCGGEHVRKNDNPGRSLAL
jgi:hypothetical protein